MESITKDVVPVVRNNLSPQNQKRYEALIAFLNYISIAVLWQAVLYDENDVINIEDGTTREGEVPVISDDRIFNWDKTIIKLEDLDNGSKIYLAIGSIEKLKEMKLGAGSTKTSTQGKPCKRRVSEVSFINY